MRGMETKKYEALSGRERRHSLGGDGLSAYSDLREKNPSQRSFLHNHTHSLVTSVTPCFPWGAGQYDFFADDTFAQQSCWRCEHLGLFGSRRKSDNWVEVSLHGKAQENGTCAREDASQGYSRAPVWKRVLRKLRAETKQIHVTCCEGLCVPTEISYDYNTFTYEKNFDKGREYWQHHPSVRVSSAPSAESLKLWRTSSDLSGFALNPSQMTRPLSQRRKSKSALKVTFADVGSKTGKTESSLTEQ
ncbi:hypothetical protein O6H91_13G011500 [Diphasiastrum complanatum]|uniref:Uncharacterized protein n=1 Tax=Diphasiastrum complanatum TaxID=34168 RepID=A0ACC2BS43_DIPCM|nr:hypothetical protein O6H91_13G011500 [Diphasiastrum complanatum]